MSLRELLRLRSSKSVHCRIHPEIDRSEAILRQKMPLGKYVLDEHVFVFLEPEDFLCLSSACRGMRRRWMHLRPFTTAPLRVPRPEVRALRLSARSTLVSFSDEDQRSPDTEDDSFCVVSDAPCDLLFTGPSRGVTPGRG